MWVQKCREGAPPADLVSGLREELTVLRVKAVVDAVAELGHGVGGSLIVADLSEAHEPIPTL